VPERCLTNALNALRHHTYSVQCAYIYPTSLVQCHRPCWLSKVCLLYLSCQQLVVCCLHDSHPTRFCDGGRQFGGGDPWGERRGHSDVFDRASAEKRLFVRPAGRGVPYFNSARVHGCGTLKRGRLKPSCAPAYRLR
jgi:hypothetical protein